MPLRQTHTYAELEVSAAAYDEVADKLKAAGYDHAFQDGVIDMHGIALTRGPEPERKLVVNSSSRMRAFVLQNGEPCSIAGRTGRGIAVVEQQPHPALRHCKGVVLLDEPFESRQDAEDFLAMSVSPMEYVGPVMERGEVRPTRCAVLVTSTEYLLTTGPGGTESWLEFVTDGAVP